MRSLSPRRRRVVLLAASSTCVSAGMLPIQHHFAQGQHPALFTAVYLGLVILPLAFAFREFAKARREEGCNRA